MKPLSNLLQWICGTQPQDSARLRRQFLRKYPQYKFETYDLRAGRRPWLHGIQPMARGKFAVWTVPMVKSGDRVRTERGLFGVTEARELTETRMHGMVVAAFVCLEDATAAEREWVEREAAAVSVPTFYEVEGREYQSFEEAL
jgi:hypothetical protein